MLLMRREYFDAIRRGEKTTTLRYWKRRMVRAGSVHRVPGLGRLRIESVEPIAEGDLTDAHARDDGLGGAAALRRALDETYDPARREGRRLYLVRFTWLAPTGPGGT